MIRYDCHINVERCVHTKAIKYLYKYMHKSHDRVTVVTESNISATDGRQRPMMQYDEIKRCLDYR